MLIRLTRLYDEDRPIRPIKDLRAATGMSLADAKGAIDTLRGMNRPRGHVEVEVPDENVASLRGTFDFDVPAPAATVDRQLVLDFIIECALQCEPDNGDGTLGMTEWESFKALRAAL